MRKLLSLFMTLCVCVGVFAYDAKIDGIYYNLYNYSDGARATVTYRDQNYNSYSGEVVIPATIEYNGTEYAVVSIGEHAFDACSALTNVVIPSSVNNIGYYAFRGCSSLSTVVIPEGVTEIYHRTFEDCSSLVNVVIPDGITRIGEYAFEYCTSLTAISLPQSITRIDEGAFYHCYSLTSIVVPESVTNIASSTFVSCSALTSVVLPKKLISIGSSAFGGSSSLSSITLPNTIVSIGENAFSSSSLSVTVLGETPASLGGNAFHENTIFFVPDVKTYQAAWKGYKFIVPLNGVSASVNIKALKDKSALQQKLGLDSLKKITSLKVSGTINSYDIMMMRNQMPNLLDIDLSDASIVANDYEYTKGYNSKKDTLTAYSFTGTGTHIRKAILPNTVTCIEQNVFNTPYLQEVVLPKNLLVIGDRTFYGCSALRSINLPESLTYIGESAFQGAGLTEVVIPANVETIGQSAFGGVSITYIECYENNYSNESSSSRWYVSWSDDNFYNSESSQYRGPYSGGPLQSVVIPANSKLKYIPRYAFAGNNNLKKIFILGDSIKSIHSAAFYRCQLDTLILPPNLTKLNTLSFGYCDGLKFVAMPNTLTEVASNAFVGCTNMDNVQFPKKLTKIGHHAFADCTNLRNVDIPGLVTDIEEYAFKDCQVKSVYSYLFDPFTIGQNTFSPYANANAILYVPNVEDTEMKYLYDTQWSQFLNRQRMDKSFVYDDFYSKGDVNIRCEDDPLHGNPNATLYPGAGLTVEDNDCDTTDLGNIIIGSDGDDAWGAVLAGCNLHLDSLIQNITIQGKKWYFFGFPFDVKIEDIRTGAKYVIYEYDGQMRAERDTTGWKRLPKDQKYLHPGHGYIFQFNFAASGEISIVVPSPRFCDMLEKIILKFFPSDKANNKSWNYASNPFLGYYDINDLNITTPITIWDVAQGNYRTVRPGDDDYYFSPYEGFFLQNVEERDFELTFDRSKAMTKKQMDEQRDTRRHAMARTQQRHSGRAIINLTLASESASDDTRIVINEGAGMGYELGLDAAKFLSTENSVPQIFSYDDSNVQYAINERPMQTGVVELGVRIPASGMYTIDATRMDTMMYLLDRKMNIMHDFSTGAYMFSAGAGMQNNRFALVRQYNAPTDAEETIENTQVDVTAEGLYIHGTADIQVYNMAGVCVADGTYSGAVALPAGVYMVVANGNTMKCVVR